MNSDKPVNLDALDWGVPKNRKTKRAEARKQRRKAALKQRIKRKRAA